MCRLKKRYQEVVRKGLQEKFNYQNVMEIPRLEKIVVNMGIAEASKDKNALQDCQNELALISGQKPVLTRARKSIANFKLREGSPIGLKVTLRNKRMYDFMDRFVNIVSPRIRDFRGFSDKSEGRSYTLGIGDQSVFPDLNLDLVKRTQGMNITFVTTARSDKECIELLRLLGLPFRNLPIVVTI